MGKGYVMDEITCLRCDSKNWYCVDEVIHKYEDLSAINEDESYFEMPVGLLRCCDCGYRWEEEDISVRDQLHIVDVTDEWRYTD